MIDLNYKHRDEPEGLQPEEIAVAVIVALIWLPMAFIFGGLL